MDYIYKDCAIQVEESDAAKRKTRAYGYSCKMKDLARKIEAVEKPEAKQQ
jgi:hypothetical protein